MIDTLTLYTNEFRIKEPYPAFQIKRSNLDASTGAFEPEFDILKTGSEAMLGRSAYLNSEDGLLRIDIDWRGLKLTTEVPKWYGEHNFMPVSERQFPEFSESIKRRLEKENIDLDIDNSRVSRLDLFRNAKMPTEPARYFPVLNTFCSGQMKINAFGYGCQGITFQNKQRAACFYDKRLHLTRKGYDVQGIPENSLRGELRLKTSEAVRRHGSGLQTFGDLRQNFSLLDEVYIRQMKKVVFHDGVIEQKQLDLFGIADAVWNECNGDFEAWLMTMSIENLLIIFESTQRIKEFLETKSPHRSTTMRRMKKIEEIRARRMKCIEAPFSYSDLYGHLADAFLKAA